MVMNMKKMLIGASLLLLGVTPWAFCVANATSYINVGVLNLTGYPVTVDMTGAAPQYHDSGAIPSFDVPATQPDNLVWKEKAIHIDSCFEMGAPAQGTGKLAFNFANADLGTGGQFGPVTLFLTYSATWDSNRNGMNPEINSISLTQNVYNTVPGVSPVTGVAQFVHANSSNYAYLDIVLYSLAPGSSGNQNVARPFDPFFPPPSSS
jgi:hypothetical protein